MARKKPKADTHETKPSFDSLLKAWVSEYPKDLAAWLMGRPPTEVRQEETCLAIASQRLTDKLLDLRFPAGPPVLLHIEFHAWSSLRARETLAVYLALIQRILRRREHRGKIFAAVMVYLDKKRFRGDPGRIEFAGAWGTRLLASYRVVKLWELPPEVILRSGRPGLLPLLPLTDGNPEKLLVQSKETILDSKRLSGETKALLVTLAFGLAGLRLKPATIKALLEEIRPMGTETVFEVLEERGRIAQSRRDILRVLTTRFGTLSPEVGPMLDRVDQLDVLESLIDAAAVAPTPAEFLRRLRAVKNGRKRTRR